MGAWPDKLLGYARRHVCLARQRGVHKPTLLFRLDWHYLRLRHRLKVSDSQMRMRVQTMVKMAATDGRKSTRVPKTVQMDNRSTALFADSESSCFISAFPSPQAFVDTAVGVVSRLSRCALLFHPFHPRTERVPSGTAFRLRRLEPWFSGVGAVVRRTPLCIQAAGFSFAFFALPRRRLTHVLPPESARVPAEAVPLSQRTRRSHPYRATS